MPATITAARASTVIESVVQRSITRLVFAWTSTAGGAVDVTTPWNFSGQILRIVTIPSSVLGTIPLPGYNVRLFDSDGANVTLNSCLNRHQMNTQQVCPLISDLIPPALANTTLRLTIDAAGPARQGTVIVYIF